MKIPMQRPLGACLLLVLGMAAATAAQAAPVQASPGGWTTLSGELVWDWWELPDVSPRGPGDIRGRCAVTMRFQVDPKTGAFTVTRENFSLNCSNSVPQGFQVSAENFPWQGTTGYALVNSAASKWQSLVPNMRFAIREINGPSPPIHIVCSPMSDWHVQWLGQATANTIQATQMSTPPGSVMIPSYGDSCSFYLRAYLSPSQTLNRTP